MAEYRLTPGAERDLENIWLYTRERWSLDQADLYIETLTTVFADLAESPKTAPSCNHIRPNYRSRSVASHVIYLYATDYGISVVRILHGQMDAPRHLSIV
jgi:toxin ParE1/3/4